MMVNEQFLIGFTNRLKAKEQTRGGLKFYEFFVKDDTIPASVTTPSDQFYNCLVFIQAPNEILIEKALGSKETIITPKSNLVAVSKRSVVTFHQMSTTLLNIKDKTVYISPNKSGYSPQK